MSSQVDVLWSIMLNLFCFDITKIIIGTSRAPPICMFWTTFSFQSGCSRFFPITISHICVHCTSWCNVQLWKILKVLEDGVSPEKTRLVGREARLHQREGNILRASVLNLSLPIFIFVFSNPIEMSFHPVQSRTRIRSFFVTEKCFYSFVQKHKRKCGKERKGKVIVSKRMQRL